MILGKVISSAVRDGVVFLAVEMPPEHVETLLALIETGYHVQFPLVLPKDKAAKLRKDWEKLITGPAEHVEIEEVTECRDSSSAKT